MPSAAGNLKIRAYIAAEFEKWDKVVKVAGIKPD